MHPALLVDRDGGIAIIRIVRPEKKNALTRDMLRAFPDTLAHAASDAATCIVLTGGPDVFSAGVDVAELGNGAADTGIDTEIAAVSTALRACPVPVIAAIEGPCMGAAVELALSCDVRVASSSATFGVPAARLGVLYRPDAIAALVGEVGRQTAMRLMVGGERITGADAIAAGIAGTLTDPGLAFDAAMRLARLVDQSVPEAVRATKAVVNAAALGEDVTRFEAVRRSLLESEARAEAVSSLRDALAAASQE
jgi:enoyl-CoA hydratase